MATILLKRGQTYNLTTGKVEGPGTGTRTCPSERPYVGLRGNDLRALRLVGGGMT